MSDEIMLVFGEDGVAREYDDTWDITIHCESEEEQKAVLAKLNTSNPEVLACGEGVLNAHPDIVRCRDCMHYGTYYRGNESKPVITHLCKWCLDRTMEPDDYCSHAERRTDAADQR